MKEKKSTYLNYGVPNNIVEKLEGMSLPVQTFRNTSKVNLVKKYKLNSTVVAEIKKLIKRKPIDNNILDMLLMKSNFICCCCHGLKGDSYLIHHIIPYSKTQDNNYNNLAVLCPTCHDLAHRNPGLTNRLTPKQIEKCKYEWGKLVEKYNAEKACRDGQIHDVDYINIPRITELCFKIFKKIPKTELTAQLTNQGALSPAGELNVEFIQKNCTGGNYLFDFIWSGSIIHHFFEVFKRILNRTHFYNLEEFLNKKSVNNNDLIGKYCFYIGGVYGKSPKFPITGKTPVTFLHFKRRNYYVQWSVKPVYLTSSTSIIRLSEHSSYAIYGVIRNVSQKIYKGKECTFFDVRPLVFGIPLKSIDRTPIIHYLKNDEFLEEDSDSD